MSGAKGARFFRIVGWLAALFFAVDAAALLLCLVAGAWWPEAARWAGNAISDGLVSWMAFQLDSLEQRTAA